MNSEQTNLPEKEVQVIQPSTTTFSKTVQESQTLAIRLDSADSPTKLQTTNKKKKNQKFDLGFQILRITNLGIFLIILNIFYVITNPFSSFNDRVSKAYNVRPSSISLAQAISGLGSTAMMIPANYLLTVIGVKPIVLLGTAFATVGSLLRYFIKDSFSWYVAGSMIFGGSFPCLPPCYPILCAIWFDGKLAKTLMGLFGVLAAFGLYAGARLPLYAADVNSSDEVFRRSIESYFSTAFIGTGLMMIIALIFMRNRRIVEEVKPESKSSEIPEAQKTEKSLNENFESQRKNEGKDQKDSQLAEQCSNLNQNLLETKPTQIDNAGTPEREIKRLSFEDQFKVLIRDRTFIFYHLGVAISISVTN